MSILGGTIPGTKAYKEEKKNKQPKTAKQTATDRHKTFKADRKLPLGEKSFNKGRPKSEWVKSAYERRQKDATKRTQSAAAKSHDDFQKKHKRGKYSKRAIAKAAEAQKKNPKLFGVDVGKEPGQGGGLLGKLNRFRKRVKGMSKDDLTIKFGNNK